LFNEVVELFSETGELRFAGQIYRGHAGLRRLYVGRIGEMYTKGKNEPVDGILADHTQLQDIVHVAPDRKTAKGRFRYFMQGATHVSVGDPALGQGSLWEAGLYENEYVREGGVWKIQVLGLNSTYRVDYQTGWRYALPFPRMSPTLYPKDPLGPDEYKEVDVRVWPRQSVLPFHYPHPVTGKAWSAQ
jgi:SnoaL-like domain